MNDSIIDIEHTPRARARGEIRLGLARLAEGDAEGAAAAFRRAIGIDPADAIAWNNLGQVLHDLGRLPEAIEAFGEALEIAPESVEARNNRALALQDLGRPHHALADFDAAIELARGRVAASVLHNRGALHHDLGDLDAARSDYDRALAIDPNHAPTYVRRGQLRKDRGELGGALGDAERAIALLPRALASPAYHLRAGVRSLASDFRGAVADYDEALAIDPRAVCSVISRGHARYHLRDRGAIADYVHAYRLDPRSAVVECVRSLASAAKARPADVLENCAKHLRIDPSDALAMARGGLTRILLGQKEAGEADLLAAREGLGEAWEFVRACGDLASRLSVGSPRLAAPGPAGPRKAWFRKPFAPLKIG
jgi:tetratricopeptide (TPR) repeat protein